MLRIIGLRMLASAVVLGGFACSTQATTTTSHSARDREAGFGLASAPTSDRSVVASPEPEVIVLRDQAPASPASAPSEPAVPPPATGPRGVVMLVPLGKFPAADIDAVADHLRVHAQVEVRTQPATPLPKAAWYAPRKRYRADALLDHLAAMYADAPSTTHVLGLTTFDISTTKPPHDDWGIFGLGQMPGRAAVVSTFRLRNKAKNAAHVHRRLATTALHELGHTLGLDHCKEPLCPMQDAEGSIVNTDAANDDFGPECRRAIDRLAPRSVVPR